MRPLHLALLAMFVLSALPLRAATAPLTLTATADREVLLARALQGMDPDVMPPRYDTKTAKITLTFTNNGDTPLTLDLFDLTNTRLQWEISGPDGRTVVQQRLPNVRALLPAPRAEDFPVLTPGKEYDVGAAALLSRRGFLFPRISAKSRSISRAIPMLPCRRRRTRR